MISIIERNVSFVRLVTKQESFFETDLEPFYVGQVGAKDSAASGEVLLFLIFDCFPRRTVFSCFRIILCCVQSLLPVTGTGSTTLFLGFLLSKKVSLQYSALLRFDCLEDSIFK